MVGVGEGVGFRPEHLGEVAKLTRVAASIFRRVVGLLHGELAENNKKE